MTFASFRLKWFLHTSDFISCPRSFPFIYLFYRSSIPRFKPQYQPFDFTLRGDKADTTPSPSNIHRTASEKFFSTSTQYPFSFIRLLLWFGCAGRGLRGFGFGLTAGGYDVRIALFFGRIRRNASKSRENALMRLGNALLWLGNALTQLGNALMWLGNALMRLGNALTRLGNALTLVETALTLAETALMRLGNASKLLKFHLLVVKVEKGLCSD